MKTLLHIKQVLKLRLKECPGDSHARNQLDHIEKLINELQKLK